MSAPDAVFRLLQSFFERNSGTGHMEMRQVAVGPCAKAHPNVVFLILRPFHPSSKHVAGDCLRTQEGALLDFLLWLFSVSV